MYDEAFYQSPEFPRVCDAGVVDGGSPGQVPQFGLFISGHCCADCDCARVTQIDAGEAREAIMKEQQRVYIEPDSRDGVRLWSISTDERLLAGWLTAAQVHQIMLERLQEGLLSPEQYAQALKDWEATSA